MAIPQLTLRALGSRPQTRNRHTAFANAKAYGTQTAFLSHSHLDADLAKGVQSFLSAQGMNVYIDWEDTSMPSKPNRQTAKVIQERILNTDLFLFLATANSMKSRWCPWEIGYADGKKPIDSILVLQTEDSNGTNFGNEYMDLYRHVSKDRDNRFIAYNTNGIGTLLKGMSKL